MLGEMRATPSLPNPRKHTLSEMIRGFKSMSARQINQGVYRGRALWQRGYYEHIIRNEKDLQNTTDYIEANPLLWDEDEENPVNVNK